MFRSISPLVFVTVSNLNWKRFVMLNVERLLIHNFPTKAKAVTLVQCEKKIEFYKSLLNIHSEHVCLLI